MVRTGRYGFGEVAHFILSGALTIVLSIPFLFLYIVALGLAAVAQICEQNHQYDVARQYYDQCLVVGRAALESDPLPQRPAELARLYNKVGNFYFDRQLFRDALRTYRLGLAIERATLPAGHSNIHVSLLNVAETYQKLGLLNRSIRIYTEVIASQRIKFGSEPKAEMATALNTIGKLHGQKGRTRLAIKYLQEALVMRRILCGDHHLDVSATLTDLGTVFCRCEMVHDALQLFTESLRIRTAILGTEHKKVSFTLYNLGLCHQLQGNDRQAITCFQETLRIELKVLGRDHRDVALTLYKLAEASKLQGDLDKALSYFVESVDIERRQTDVDFEAMATTLHEIGSIHLARGHVECMMDSLVEAAGMLRCLGRDFLSLAASPALNVAIALHSLSASMA
jgi:tetratricopeptide (TPR) repeat protein